ncbi:MAG: radical SAM protein [Burkholderiales bacterium]
MSGQTSSSNVPLHSADHSRAYEGFTYVYPVVSRRAGGVSIGVNLNTNNACNWRCIYCQVPNLTRGAPLAVDLEKLESELRTMLRDVLKGNFMSRRVAEGARQLHDIALSGNGEPTSAREFGGVIDMIGHVRRQESVPDAIKTVLITNGSLMHRPMVGRAVAALAKINGEVWFKIDRATDAAMRKVNNTRTGMSRVHSNLVISANACPTWIQTCIFLLDGLGPDDTERMAYLEFLEKTLAEGVVLQGVMLYGLARPSHQPEAPRLAHFPVAQMEEMARDIRKLGLKVIVTP